VGWRALRITADTNLLLRTVLHDDPRQSALADALLAKATTIAIPPTVFCEFAWVLRRGYGYSNDEIAVAIAAVRDLETVSTDASAVESGLAVLRAGGDFADGVIAQQGTALGGGTFASFDREAVAILRNERIEAGEPGQLLAE